MKLRFLKAVASGRGHFAAGSVHEVADRHAAEVYMKHGYAVEVKDDTVRAGSGKPEKRPANGS